MRSGHLGGAGGSHPGQDHSGGSHATTLAQVRGGHAVLEIGDKGSAVKEVQHLLHVSADGIFGPKTQHAVRTFQRAHHLEVDGIVGRHTLAALEHRAHPEPHKGDKDHKDDKHDKDHHDKDHGHEHPAHGHDESRHGAAQRQRMLGVARSASAGRRPDGRCYFHVCHFFIQCGGYGKIKNPYTQFPSSALPEAHDFADLMNSRGPAHFGLERLSIHNPYDAPAGAIVVVAAGSPGTHHPTAGDIAIAGGDGAFYNGGLMGYGGRAGWDASRRARLLGCYIPR